MTLLEIAKQHLRIQEPTQQMIKNTLLLILAIFTISCSCRVENLSISEKEWCKPYEPGQMLVFKSSRNNIDTIYVLKKVTFHTNEECNFAIGNTQNHGISIDLKPQICRNEFYCEADISIVEDHNENSTLPFFRIFGLEYDANYRDNNLIETQLKFQNKTLKVFRFEDKVNCTNYGTNYLKIFYWNKEIGLIQYESYDGETFTLSNFQ